MFFEILTVQSFSPKIIKNLLFFDYPRGKPTRYFAEKFTLRVTVNSYDYFLIDPEAEPREILSIKDDLAWVMALSEFPTLIHPMKHS